MTENINNFDLALDISGIPEFHVNSYDVSYLSSVRQRRVLVVSDQLKHRPGGIS